MVFPKQDESTIYFYKPHEEPYGVFSQWSHHPFQIPGKDEMVFQTAEQYMMYNKALLFKDDITAEMIMEAESPAEQKRLGRRVANFDEDVWKTQRCHLVREGNYYKFTAAVDEGDREMLKKVLLETGDKEIVEASPRDRIWGIGFGGKNAPANRHRWGLNLLGKALMEVRAQLVAEKEGEGKN